MFEDHRLSKVSILIQQKKYAEAEKMLADLLREDPNNTRFLALLAEVNIGLGKFDTANTLIENAIGLAPDDARLFYLKAFTSLHRDQFDDAENSIRQATKLDPHEAEYVALLANLRLVRKKYDEALELADHALELDPENLLALNTRSTALIKLGRKAESFETIEGALREDPNNAYTHSNYGWGLLEKGDHRKALEHFKEALKTDPNNEYARSGMLEAMKASNPVYRLFLKYAFWMGNFTAKYQWGIIIGLYLAMRGMQSLANSNENLRPYLTPVIITLIIFAFSTWIITPVSNLFLRFNRYGQLLLSQKQKISSSLVAISLAACLAGIAAYAMLSDERYLSVAAFGLAMMLPFSVMFSPSRYKHALLVYALALAAVGLIAIGITFSTGELLHGVSTIFIFGFIAFQWIANFLVIGADNR
ncbi:tetratricopeptide repeat protein [Terrimonas sp. NA20]|uniref:Tetratricopeptide repeat protein n=1 Tax=Terrimonas ginsenosidimutans TaxID=2908004 RepID=A0ABS9KWP6_9BACT|nr:tetratricopeptide repeat protein [Terrimonas ginsenosidimutans]MCG2616745.1 tetratricopeptide repeat protein [Terrimonas ginsenosidimutans]